MTYAVVVKVLPCTNYLPTRYKVSVKGQADVIFRQPLHCDGSVHLPTYFAIKRLRALGWLAYDVNPLEYVIHGLLPNGDHVILLK